MLFKMLFCMRIGFFCCLILLCSIANLKANTYSYYQDVTKEIGIENVLKLEFTPFGNEIKKGVNNGIYWIKVETDATTEVVEFQSPHLLDIKCYEGLRN